MTPYKIWRLQQRRNRVEKEYEREIRTATTAVDRQRIEYEMQFDLESFDNSLRVIRTRRLLKSARNLDISIPSGTEYWEQDQLTQEFYMNDAAREDLRQRIRKEKKEKRSLWKDILLLTSGVAAVAQLVWSFVKFLSNH